MQTATRMLTPPSGVPPLVRRIGSTTSQNSSLALCSNCARRLQHLSSLSSPPRVIRRSIPNSTVSTARSYATERPPSTSLEPSSIPPSSSPPPPPNGDHKHSPDLSWPAPTNPRNPYETPTPYAIFSMSPSDPYSKHRFYELVKLYHPDRQKHTSPTLSPTAALQRYRLVIAANELLSQPRRRRLYDSTGAGWTGRPEFGPSPPSWEYENQSSKTGWSGFNDNNAKSGADPRANATWEDWEAWNLRHTRTQGDQRPVFMNNGTFVVLVCVCAGIAASLEGQRAGVDSRTMLEQVEARHGRNSRDLMKRREESKTGPEDGLGVGEAGWGNDARLRRFLRVRGVVDGENEMEPVGGEREGSVFVSEEEMRRKEGGR